MLPARSTRRVFGVFSYPMATIPHEIETVDVLAETDHYVVARIAAADAPHVAVYSVHLSDDADLFERAYACGLVPRSADCVEIISHDADWTVDGGPGCQLVYRQAI
jgi:hypothetical protein